MNKSEYCDAPVETVLQEAKAPTLTEGSAGCQYITHPPVKLSRRLVRLFRKTIRLSLDCSVVEVLRYIKEQTSHPTVYKMIHERAAMTSAMYIEQKLGTALLFSTREKLWDYALSKVNNDGIYAEFGVFSGYSINHFAKALSRKNIEVYGFDSFEGLKEDWYGTELPSGAFDLEGQLPEVRSNVVLVKGWFDSTVPQFLNNHKGVFAFIHLDADTYESTALVLDLLKSRIAKGTIIVFDEYLGFPNWPNGEYLAWQEFVNKEKHRYRYVGFSATQAAVQVV